MKRFWPVVLSAVALCGCSETDPVTRPGSEPLDRLLTKEARALAATPIQLPGAGGSGSGNVCVELLGLARQGGVIQNEAGQDRLTVNQELWGRLPEEARRAISACVEAERNARTRRPG